LRLSLHTTIAAEIGDGRLAILDVAGLPEWFVVHPATKRMMPAARSLRDFLVAAGEVAASRGNHSAKRK
jgi:hypothetical protein